MPHPRRGIVFAIDVEPDARTWIQDDKCRGVALTLQELYELRPKLAEISQAPVRFNWFFRFDPQIEQTWGRRNWVSEASPKLIPWIQECADFAGIHTHFWKWDEVRERWFSDFADVDWHAHCLRTCIRAYQSIWGHRPAASRFGDRWFATHLVKLLLQEGIQYDLTVEPGVPDHPMPDDPFATAWLPDYRDAPRTPYRPSLDNFLIPARESNSALWMVPLTTTQPARWAPIRRFPFLAKASRTLNLVMHPRAVWSCLSTEIERPCMEPLVFVLRAGDLSHPRFLAAFRFVTERLVRHKGLRQCQFTGVEDAVRSFVPIPPQR